MYRVSWTTDTVYIYVCLDDHLHRNVQEVSYNTCLRAKLTSCSSFVYFSAISIQGQSLFMNSISSRNYMYVKFTAHVHVRFV